MIIPARQSRPPQRRLPSGATSVEHLSFASGEVFDTPHEVKPYCAIFRVDDQILFEWPVNSVGEGHARIREALSFLRQKLVERGNTVTPTSIN
jgi:hypothetical protein